VTTALDSNVLVALWGSDPGLGLAAEAALETAYRHGNLAVAAPVFAELMAAPNRTENFVNGFFEEAGIVVDWALSEAIWRLAGGAFRGYVERRRKQGESGTRRILADFVIGAHAANYGYHLLTLDERLYRAAFPNLKIDRI
jgi:predicted nucleic acid-binding protein